MGKQYAVSYELKSLTFKQQSWYLNFCALFMKMYHWDIKKLGNKWHSVENKTHIMQHILKMQRTSLLA